MVLIAHYVAKISLSLKSKNTTTTDLELAFDDADKWDEPLASLPGLTKIRNLFL